MNEMTSSDGDNRNNSLLSQIGDIAAPTIKELDNSAIEMKNASKDTTVNTDVSKTFDMNTLIGMMDENIKADKSWAKFKNPADLAKSYLELQKMVGKKGEIPSDEAAPELWNEFYSKLGKPEKADGYKIDIPEVLKNIEGVDGKVEKLKQFAFESNLTTKQANTLFNRLLDMEVSDINNSQLHFDETSKANQEKLKTAWGNGIDAMASEVKALEERLGILEAFENSGLNDNPDLLIAFGKIAQELRETSTIDTAIASTPVGIEAEIAELNSQAREFMRNGRPVPANIQNKLQDLFRRMG